MAISVSDTRKLWRLASSRCSYFDCGLELVKEEKDGVRGEMAHIVAEEEGGPRGKSELSQMERNKYENLILLCPNHHTLIDNNEKDWTVKRLHEMKRQHEDWVKAQLAKGRAWHPHILAGHLHYINVPRLLLDPNAYTFNGYLNGNTDNIKVLSELSLPELAQIKSLTEGFLKSWQPPVLSLNDISNENVGARIKFEADFRTKNVPGPYELSSFKLKGDIHKDPHIYCKIGERKVYVTINPYWIATDTAFLLFKSGRITFSGLGILNKVEAKEAFITPLIIGSPDYPGSEFATGRAFGDIPFI